MLALQNSKQNLGNATGKETNGQSADAASKSGTGGIIKFTNYRTVPCKNFHGP